MVFGGLAAFLQFVAITSHRWFVADLGLDQVRVGLRDARFCDAFDHCTGFALPTDLNLAASLLFYGGWLSALGMVVAMLAHWSHSSDRFWRPVGVLSLLVGSLAPLTLASDVVGAGPGAAFVLALIGFGLGGYVGLKRSWGDEAPRPRSVDGELPSARVRR
jgi:hypothetical protein